MAAAYAALVSVSHIVDQLEHHPHPPISLDKQRVDSLTAKLTFLQQFLQGYNNHFGYSNDEDNLESRIAEAAYAAEDVIESHIADRILGGEEETGSTGFYRDLQKVMEEMDSIMTEIKEMLGVEDRLHRLVSVKTAPSFKSSSSNSMLMVGFDDFLLEVLDKLTGEGLDRRIIPIVGMGGMGKTTLVRNIYAKPLVKEYFHIKAWVTISQSYNNVQKILKEFLAQVTKDGGDDLSEDEFLAQVTKDGGDDLSEDDLGEILHKHLSSRRYLIVMDDIWSIEAWDAVRRFLPDNENGSRILITTRSSKLAFQLTGTHGFKMRFLNEVDSWNLFSRIVFGEEAACPPQLAKIGKKIVGNCRGLPLSIVVIGGLLARSTQTQQYWEYVAENLNSIVNLEDDEHCLQILHTSYNSMPIHLKPCFLYMGVLEEDSEIRKSDLTKLWVAEGFLKQKDGRSLEETAKEYLRELVDRNLIFLVEKPNCPGKLKLCKIHDLLRDLCLRETRKQKFLYALGVHKLNIPQDIKGERRVCIHGKKHSLEDLNEMEPSSVARSLIWEDEESVPIFGLRFLRVYSTTLSYLFLDQDLVEDICRSVNLRYISLRQVVWDSTYKFSSLSLLWNLQTLVIGSATDVIAPSEIWKMSQLKHVMIWGLVKLPDPPTDDDDVVILEKLQALLTVMDFKCDDEVVKRMPNIKKLGVVYWGKDKEILQDYRLDKIGLLHKLQSLSLANKVFGFSPAMQDLKFPHSLKKLSLRGTGLQWEDMNIMIGSLPCLQVLKLKFDACRGTEWRTVEGQFRSLKFLKISECYDLVDWETDSSHFPRLEHLVLYRLGELNEVPSSIGDIATLQSIQLDMQCRSSALASAQRIQEEQEELGNASLRVHLPFDDLDYEDEDEDIEEEHSEDAD